MPPPPPLAPGGEPVAAFPAARHAPHTYPGRTIEGDFLLLDDRVLPIVGRRRSEPLQVGGADGPPLDELLRARGEASLAERVAVVGYGANRCPGSLHVKMSHHDYVSPGVGISIPSLLVEIPAVEVAWGGISEQGCAYADLIPSGDHVAEAVVVHVNLFDADQFRAINASEGVGRAGYALAHIGELDVGGPEPLPALCYAGPAAPYRSVCTGRPLAVSAVSARGRTIEACTTIALLQRLIDEHDLHDEVAALLPTHHLAPDPTALLAQHVSAAINRAWWLRRSSGVFASPAPDLLAMLWRALRSQAGPRSSFDAFAARNALLDAAHLDVDRYRPPTSLLAAWSTG